MRIALVIGGIFLWSAVILGRLVQVQVLRHEEYLQQAMSQQHTTDEVPAPRGIIYDSHMEPLARNTTLKTVMAVPGLIEDKKKKEVAAALASILDLDAAKLLDRMTNPARRKNLVVKRMIDPQCEGRIEALKVDGIYFQEESRRVYPGKELACHVLGFVNMEGVGGAGVESQYDKELKGAAGQEVLEVDARGRAFRARMAQQPRPGDDLYLSIDKAIQYIAERELKDGVESTNAKGGTAIVMESDTGRILALANYPNFNCNAYNEVEPELLLDRAISVLFEPGSTFKVVVATAALEAGLTRPDEQIDCQMGRITVGRHVFHDHKPYGILTFNEVLEKSSNIGAAKLGLRLGEQRLYDALRMFGFGAKTRIDLPAEIVGLVRDLNDWSGLSVAAISFGQEVGVTSMQMITAINTIANGGFRVRPSVVDRVIDQNGDLMRVNEPAPVRIIKSETAAAVRYAFEGVILRGTAKKAALDGYRAAGKTGTAQKIVDGRYSSSKYVASFIGFAPLPRPRITVLVQIDEPKGVIYGGEVSAPIFRRITQGTLMQLRVPTDQPLPFQPEKAEPVPADDSQDFIPNATPVQPLTASLEGGGTLNPDGSITVLSPVDSVMVPDFTGLSKRSVIERCLELGFIPQTSGTGTAVSQEPAAGTLMAAGNSCRITFGRGKPAITNKPAGTRRKPAASAGLRAASGRR